MRLEGRQVTYISVTEHKTGNIIWINAQYIVAVEPEWFGSIVVLASKSGYDVNEPVDVVMDKIRIASWK
jgi:hypothetical protein